MPLLPRKRGTPPNIQCEEVPCNVPGLQGHCRVFLGHKGKNGYGQVSLNGKLVLVHRYCWELANGPIPQALLIDHQCRNRGCCNPDHLRVVTKRVNNIENSVSPFAANCAKTHCCRGHEFTEQNTGVHHGRRRCKACHRDEERKANATRNR